MTPASPYAARPWEARYDYWVRTKLTYPGRPLADVLAITAVERPDKPATHFLGAELTYQDLKRRADALAVSLARFGIAKGDRVGIMLPNCPQYIIAAFAILKLGAVVVNINPAYTAREAQIVAADSGARLVITLDALTPIVQSIVAQSSIERIIVTSIGEYSAMCAPAPRIDGVETLADLLLPANLAELPKVAIDPHDLAVLQYTGGTTGTPKGAMLTHRNIWANILQNESWTNPAYVYGGNERYLVVIPYFHIYAFTVCMMVGLRIGALQIIHPKYDPDAVLTSIRHLHPTYFPAVPTVFVSLLNHPKFAESGLERVRLFNSGGAPCPIEVMDEWERRTGRPLNEGYGLSETSPVTHSTSQLAERRLGTIGLPFPDTDVKIVDVETGKRELAVGETGELCIAGPQVMIGYWNKPAETAQALRTHADARVWFHTGDIARMDAEGYTSIVQRKKDMIIVDGYNVYPSDVEGVLYAHPAVRLAAVIGVPDAYHGEIVKACIAFKPGTSATADEIIAHCRQNLAEYKVPRLVDIRDTLPMSAVGKILYRVLRDEHATADEARLKARAPAEG
ncbi:MAG TPA: long-chain fatty acid--CoA ligase [Vicinamibacterales bacterium]|nr:long-chain fatty acid--CoA ligase [Vicinamibacterales bacterium]